MIPERRPIGAACTYSKADVLNMTSHSLGSLEAVGMLDLLENDRRPTFVVDLETNLPTSNGPLCPIFYNETLRNFPSLQNAICDDSGVRDLHWPTGQSYADFRRWVGQRHDNTVVPDYMPVTFRNMTWDVATVKGRWNVVSARLGVSPYTSSFMDTLLFSDVSGSSSSVHTSSASTPSFCSSQTRHTSPSATSNTSPGDAESLHNRHDRSASGSYFNYTDDACDPVKPPNLDEVQNESGSEQKSWSLSSGAVGSPDSPRTRNQQAALTALDPRLMNELRLQREELVKKTGLIDRIAAIEAVAISVITVDGELVFANDEW